MLPLTVPEARRLLQALAGPPARRAGRLRGAGWRRAHQAVARRSHAARRARRDPPAKQRDPPVVAVPGTPALTDARWARVAPLLPAPGRRGKRWSDHRRVLGGILWVLRAGASWREAPAQFGPWQTSHSRYRRWQRDGTWARILAALLQPEPASAEATIQLQL